MKEKIDLVTLPKKSFWKLSVPIIAFCVFDAIYGIVDMFWVSKISMDAFYAMGMSIPFVTFVFSVGDSIGQVLIQSCPVLSDREIMKVHTMH